MSSKIIGAGLVAFALSAVMAPVTVSVPAQAQSQTDWYVNDEPSLFGPAEYWFLGDAGHGYGSNNYRYTYAIGGESSADNWARWEMGERVGRQEIQVYVPGNHATATVNYHIRIGSDTSRKAVAQRNVSGWYSLGDWTTDGSEVAVSVYDNDAQQHWERDGALSSSIGVDAIRMRCVSDCGAAPPPTTTTTTAPPSSNDVIDDGQGPSGSSPWFVNDVPDLIGRPENFVAGYVGKGYGPNDYVYMYAIGGDVGPDNSAVWEMGRRAGRQVVALFVPCDQATATVRYRILVDGRSVASPQVAQSEECGWVRRGPYDFDGGDVTIRLHDNDADQHLDRDGPGPSRIGVDAVAMRCVARCVESEQTATPPTAPTEVRIEARKLADGRVEFRLDIDGEKWLPPARHLRYETAETGRWVRSSPYAFESGDRPSPVPIALLTSTGVPVAVLERAAGGHLVRTPCGNTAEVAGGTPIGPVRVVLDPGHGGPANPGTVGPNGLVERDLNLTLAEATVAELAARDISATMTRTGDYGVSAAVRVAFADALGAEALVSIHHNGPTWQPMEEPGTEVYQQSKSDDSARLAGVLYEEITAALRTFEGVEWTGLADAGVKRIVWPNSGDVLGMIRLPLTTAVLIEFGYLTNASEAELFATDEYIAAASRATAAGIEAYLATDRPGTGFIAEPRIYGFPPGDLSRLRCAEVPLQ